MKVIGNRILRSTIVGCCGALTAAVPLSFILMMTRRTSLVTASFGIILGGALASFFIIFEHLWHQRDGDLLSRTIKSGLIGAVGGGIGAYLGQSIFMAWGSRVVGTSAAGIGIPISMGAAAGWALTGIGVALAITLPFSNNRSRWLHASLGGAAGGLVGGLVMQMARPMMGTGSLTFGLVVLGGAVGLGISWAERTLSIARLQVLEGPGRGSEFPLGRETLIGSDRKCPIHLSGAGVASRHAKIRVQNRKTFLEDLGAPKGLILNGQKMKEQVSRLSHGDLIKMGDNLLRVNLPSSRSVAGKMAAVLIALMVFQPGTIFADYGLADPGLADNEARITQVDPSKYPVVDIYTTLPGEMGPGRVRTFAVTEGDMEAVVLEIRDLARGTRDVPISVSLVVDTSGSMRGEKILHARDALHSFVDIIPETATINLISFNSTVNVLATSITPGMVGRHAYGLSASGHTALFDAIHRGSELLSGQPGRKVVVTLTDGKADWGQVSMEDALGFAEMEGVSLLFVGLGEDARKNRLAAMASRTGGRAVFTHLPSGIESLFAGFAMDLSREVLVRYRAADTDGQVVPVTLSMISGKGIRSISGRYMSPESTFMGTSGNTSSALFIIGLLGPVGLLAVARMNAFNMTNRSLLLVEGSSQATRQMTRLLNVSGMTVPMSIGGETLLINNRPADGTQILKGGETVTFGDTTMFFRGS